MRDTRKTDTKGSLEWEERSRGSSVNQGMIAGRHLPAPLREVLHPLWASVCSLEKGMNMFCHIQLWCTLNEVNMPESGTELESGGSRLLWGLEFLQLGEHSWKTRIQNKSDCVLRMRKEITTNYVSLNCRMLLASQNLEKQHNILIN